MKNIFKNNLYIMANVFILGSLVYYWIATTLMNPIAIGLILVFMAHLYLVKGMAKMIFPVIFVVCNLYMFLALFSELSEFPTLNMEALTMLSIGTLYLGLNIASGIIIMLKISSPTDFVEEVKS